MPFRSGQVPPNALYPTLQPRAIQLRREGLGNGEIAARLGTSQQNIHYWIGPTPRASGGCARHRHGLRDRAYYLRSAGYTVSEIAEEMNLPRSTVGGWVRGMPCGM